MVQDGVGRIDVAIALLQKIETQIHILKRNREFIFIETVDLPELVPREQHTGSRNSGTIPR
jgi:hypothetical protein